MAIFVNASVCAQTPARFHHLHLNATDPQAAIQFYSSRFEAQGDKFLGRVPSLRTHKSWLLFTKVASPPAADMSTAIWHFGWGATDVHVKYQQLQEQGTRFITPLTDISERVGRPFYYAYVAGPDGAVIEINTATENRFGHVHLFSTNPVSAGEWYVRHFGAQWTSPPSREKRMYGRLQVGPSANLMIDDTLLIIYPIEYAKVAYPENWKERTEMESTRGHVIDHIGLGVDDLSATLTRLRAAGVTITAEARTISQDFKSAFIEGPDRIAIELVETKAGSNAAPSARAIP